MTNNNNIPKNWKLVSLVNDLQFIKTGVPEFKGKKKYYSTGSIKEDKVTFEGEYEFNNKPSRANRISKLGDVFQARMKDTDKAILITNELDKQLFSTGFFQIRGDNKLFNKFIYYYLTSNLFKQQKDKLCSGSTQSALNDESAKKIFVPLPPFEEQQTIVAKIEELLSELENGKQQLLTAQQLLKVYRQSLLKWAFEGRLTNSTNTQIVSLGSVIEKPKYGTSKKCDYKTNGTGVLRIPNIENGYISTTDLKFAEFTKDELETYSLKSGDLLIIRSNGSIDLVGKCALIQEKDCKFLFAGYLIRLRPLQEKVNPKFLQYVLSSHNLRIQIESKAKSTSGVNNINTEEIKSLEIPLPNLAEQKLIVSELESKLTVCDKIEETISQSLQQAEALKQSILKKAFEGKLVAYK